MSSGWSLQEPARGGLGLTVSLSPPPELPRSLQGGFHRQDSGAPVRPRLSMSSVLSVAMSLVILGPRTLKGPWGAGRALSP